MLLYITVETNMGADAEALVLGVYSTKEKAQQSLAAAIREYVEGLPDEAPFGQEITDRGILIRSAKGSGVLYNIIVRTLDE